MSKTIFAIGYANQEDCNMNRGAECSVECDTIADAKARAKYYLTDAYQRSCEASVPLGYSQVLVNGQCHSDFFRQ